MLSQSRQFDLRPGVRMPDWSMVTQPAAREALASIYDIFGMGEKFARISRDEDVVWQAVLAHFAATGQGPSEREVAERTPLPIGTIRDVLKIMRGRDLVVLDEAKGTVTGAYPFTQAATGHRVTLGATTLTAMCAIDALGIGAMYGQDVMIRSMCRHCGSDIAIATRDQGETVASAAPTGAVVWSGVRYADNCAANSLCRVLVFFCSDEHLIAWRSETDPSARGYRLTVDEAMEVGKAIFRPIRAGVAQSSWAKRSTRRE